MNFEITEEWIRRAIESCKTRVHNYKNKLKNCTETSTIKLNKQIMLEEIKIIVLLEKLERMIGCDFCNKEYAIMSGSKMTWETVHTGCKALFCPNCGKDLRGVNNE